MSVGQSKVLKKCGPTQFLSARVLGLALVLFAAGCSNEGVYTAFDAAKLTPRGQSGYEATMVADFQPFQRFKETGKTPQTGYSGYMTLSTTVRPVSEMTVNSEARTIASANDGYVIEANIQF